MRKIFLFVVFAFVFGNGILVSAVQETQKKTETVLPAKTERTAAQDAALLKTPTKNPTQCDGEICLLESFPGGSGKISTEGGAFGIMEVYISRIFLFGAALVSMVAVIWIIIGGYEIMFRGTFSGEISEGKEKIQRALLGLVLVFISALILHTINPTFFQL